MSNLNLSMSTTTTGTTIMAALSTLTPIQFSDLTHSLSLHLRLENRHLHSLLSSPIRFSVTLQFLKSLSFDEKTLLIARYLLTTLKQLTHIWDITQLSSHHSGEHRFRLKEADAVSLLFLLCEFHHQHHHSQSSCLNNSPMSNWRSILNDYYISTLTLTLSGIGIGVASSSTSSAHMVLCSYIDTITRCQRFLEETGYLCRGHNNGNKVMMSASVAAVVSLNRVEIGRRVGGVLLECVICKEMMSEGRDVCELPCEHLFHWSCILIWLKKRNTCPCCRFQLPTDDLFGEIERLWGLVVNKSCS